MDDLRLPGRRDELPVWVLVVEEVVVDHHRQKTDLDAPECAWEEERHMVVVVVVEVPEEAEVEGKIRSQPR